MNTQKIDARLNSDKFNFLRTSKYCSICKKTYHNTEREHWDLHHKTVKQSTEKGCKK